MVAWTAKDLEESGHSVIKVLSWHLPRGTEENDEFLSQDNQYPS
jgi:hypothetical protein